MSYPVAAVSVTVATVTAVLLRHICEVCGVEDVLTADDAFAAGWDYPPRIGGFGVISPRTCPDCEVSKTVWWALVVERYTPDMLTERQRATMDRIAGEPGSVMVSADGSSD